MIAIEAFAPDIFIKRATEITDDFQKPERFTVEMPTYFENSDDVDLDLYIMFTTDHVANLMKQGEDEANAVTFACEHKLLSSGPTDGTKIKIWLIDDLGLDAYLEHLKGFCTEINIITDPALI